MVLGDVMFWLGIGMLAGGLLWRMRRRGAEPSVASRRLSHAPSLLMLVGVVLAIAGLALIGACSTGRRGLVSLPDPAHPVTHDAVAAISH